MKSINKARVTKGRALFEIKLGDSIEGLVRESNFNMRANSLGNSRQRSVGSKNSDMNSRMTSASKKTNVLY